jgi:large subunit ribosomal protein L9
MGKSIEVILLEDVPELGRSGDACRVRSGYARNFLFPKKRAVTMTAGTKRLIEKKRADALVRLSREKDEAEALLLKLEKLTLTCSVKANADGRLFGSVSPADVLAKLAADTGVTLQKKQLAMYEPFKSLGDHEATLQLHPEVRGKLKVKVVADKVADASSRAE